MRIPGTPQLGFICPSCNHGMRPVCDACERQQAEVNDEKVVYMETDITDDPDYMASWSRAAEAHSEREIAAHRAQEEEDACLRATPGYQALLDFFDNAFGVDINIDQEVDEDGSTGVITASLRGVPWLQCDSGHGASSEAAVAALRAEVVSALRAAADYLANPEP